MGQKIPIFKTIDFLDFKSKTRFGNHGNPPYIKTLLTEDKIMVCEIHSSENLTENQ